MKNFVNQYSKQYEKSEDERIECVAKNALSDKNPFISWELIAWKAGRLKLNNDTISDNEKLFGRDGGEYVWDGKNGMGRDIGGDKDEGIEIKKERINTFINEVNNLAKIPLSEEGLKFKNYNKDEFERVYDHLINIEKECGVKNIGAVYTITLIYFLSKGKFPIYDKYAHIAAKALYLGANPANIWVGEAPGKNEKTKVFNMYFEYCWLLKRIFEVKKYCYICRDKDQALWVYGHSKRQYEPIVFPKTYSDRSMKDF